MRAAILTVGSELLADRVDTNSVRLSEVLARVGVRVAAKSAIGDRLDELAAEVGRLAAAYELVLVTGGLGPTSDDLTREAVARALDRELILDDELAERIEARFRALGRPMPAVNRKQAEVIDGARVLDNPRGSAPGLYLETPSSALFLFPGVPRELIGMVDAELVPWLAERVGGAALERRGIRVACMAESAVEELIAPVYRDHDRAAISVLASPGDVRVRWTLPAEAGRDLDAVGAQLQELLGDAVYARGEESLEEVVGRLAVGRGVTLASAESCTGGLVAERLTRVAGSSAFFHGGVVAYANEVKVGLLAVERRSLEEHGAVSRAVACEMATGARLRLGTDLAVAITGIAGPGGGSELKPVGTVCIAWSSAAGTEATHCRFPGDREMVRGLAAQWALDGLRRLLLEKPLLAGTPEPVCAEPVCEDPGRGELDG